MYLICVHVCVCVCFAPFPSRYAFTILSNVGVFAALFVLLEFVSVAPYMPGVPAANITHQSAKHNSSTISPNDVWIFSVSTWNIVSDGVSLRTWSSRGSVVRALGAKTRGPGFDSQRLPDVFTSSKLSDVDG